MILVKLSFFPSAPLVEGVLLMNAANGIQSATLANWAYGVIALKEDARGRRSAVVTHLPAEDLRIKIRTVKGTKEVFSCVLQESLRFTDSGKFVIVDLPRLDEGDVLLLKSAVSSLSPRKLGSKGVIK